MSNFTNLSSIQKPKYCCWVINYQCMLRCKICYIWNTRYDKSLEPSMERKKSFVKSLKGVVDSDFEFHLSGGEPLLSEGILDLVNFIKGEGYKTDLVTNGYLIDEEMAKQIVDSNLDTLTISLDGIDEETHDFIRGVKGVYRKVMDAINNIDRHRKDIPRISILTVITGQNLRELLDMVDWVQKDSRLEMISFQAITQPFSTGMDNFWFAKEPYGYLWPKDLFQVKSVMEELIRRKNNGARIGNQAGHFRHFKLYFEDPNRFLKTIKCNLGDYEFHIDPFGKVFFCCLTEPIGNIKNDLLPDIWHAPKTRKIREDVYNCKRNCHIMINCFYEDEEIAKCKT